MVSAKQGLLEQDRGQSVESKTRSALVRACSCSQKDQLEEIIERLEWLEYITYLSALTGKLSLLGLQEEVCTRVNKANKIRDVTPVFDNVHHGGVR